MRAFELVWPGGEHTFALRIGELEAIQQATGGGPGEVLNRLRQCMPPHSAMLGPWLVADVLDTIRLGLIGGGMPQIEARKIVREQFDRIGPVELIPTAADILVEALRVPDDAPEKTEGEAMPPDDGTSET